MNIVLSHSSAFRYYRTPPVVLALYGDCYGIDVSRERRRALRGSGSFGPLDMPIHVLVRSKTHVKATKTCIPHIWSGEIAPGMIRATDLGFAVTSPVFTMLCLAAKSSVAQVTMMLYELMGLFAVYRARHGEREYLQKLVDTGSFPIIDGWKPMLDNNGNITDLWDRPPLITIDEAQRFCNQFRGMRGIGRLRQALDDVWGVARSPFEVQAAMLLGLPRRRGGYGFGSFELNKAIRLSDAARAIARQQTCCIDLYAEGAEGLPPIAIECQGAGYHGGSERNAMDDNRALALQSMGLTVVRLRYEQIADPWRLQQVASFLLGKHGRVWAPKTERLEQKERELRADVLTDWWRLGSA